MATFDQEEHYIIASDKVQKLRAFYIKIIVFIFVIGIYFASFYYPSIEKNWPFWFLLFWGIWLIYGWLKLFSNFWIFSKDWEDKKIKKEIEKLKNNNK